MQTHGTTSTPGYLSFYLQAKRYLASTGRPPSLKEHKVLELYETWGRTCPMEWTDTPNQSPVAPVDEETWEPNPLLLMVNHLQLHLPGTCQTPT